jgi:hypothetical protein
MTMTRTEIEAELYRLLGHTCGGRMTLHPDGTRDQGDHTCYGCSRYIQLSNMLSDMIQAEAVGEKTDG